MATDVRSPIDLAEEPNLHRETSTISLWRGYVTATFYAHSDDGGVIAESQAFRWRKASAPPNGATARAAFDALAATLDELGWTSAEGDGNAWYEVTFERYVVRPGQVIEPILQPAVLTPHPPVAIARPTAVVRSTAGVLPQSLPAARPQPEPRGRRQRRRSTVAAGVAVLTLIVVSGLLLSLHTKPATGSHQRHAGPAIATPRTTTPVPATAPAVVAPVVRLRVSGVGRGSWLEVRRGSSTGARLYNNVLANGKSVLFKGPRLWAQFGAAGNLAIVVDGKRVPFNGTIEHMFVANPH
jgi:hypothetical protein